MHIPDKKQQKLELELEKCILVEYSLEQKGYKCYNPSTQKVRVSRDVVYEESASWYEPRTTTTSFDPESAEQEMEDEDQLEYIFEGSPITTRLSGPREPLSDQSTSRPSPKLGKGKAKMLEYEDQVDNKSLHSLDIEFEGLDTLMRTTKKAIDPANEKLRRST